MALPLLSLPPPSVLAQSFSGFWHWFWLAVDAFSRWIAATMGEDFWASAALFLIVGGISMLSLVVILVLLRAVFPFNDDGMFSAHKSQKPGRRLAGLPDGYAAAPMPAVGHRPSAVELVAPDTSDEVLMKKGRRVASNLQLAGLDDLLDPIVEKGSGHPRVLRHERDYSLVRFYGCRGCRDRNVPDDVAYWTYACAFHRGLLHEGFQRLLGTSDVLVREVNCHRKGAPACDFEVWH